MVELINKYVEDMKLRWSESTIRSEKSRLTNLAVTLETGRPEALWIATQKLQPYARTTTWTRVIAFIDWAIQSGAQVGPNKYKIFREKNVRQFKNTYRRSAPSISYNEAIARINQHPNPQVRAKAMDLLKTGMRWTESFTLQDGWIIGKGGKSRRVSKHAKAAPFTASYHTFWREMRKVGLKPHDLRKIAAYQLLKSGANPFELAQIMGWSSVNTAMSYIQIEGKRVDELTEEAFK